MKNMSKRRGFTLIETLVASTLFLTLFSGIISGFVFVGHQAAKQSYLGNALSVGQLVLEELILLPQDSPELRNTINHQRIYNAQGDEDPDGIYVLDWVLTPNIPITGSRELALEISWNNNRAAKFSLKTYRN